jgi:hypothetical protein
MSENTNPNGSVDGSISGAANAFMSMIEPQSEEAQAQPEDREEVEFNADANADDTGYEEEAVEEPTKYRVKANGEELEVSLDELLNGYSRTADYQKKTQSLAEQRKAIEAERSKIADTARIRDTYAQRLQVIEQKLQEQSGTEDLSQLRENDPIGYALAVADRSEKEKQIQAIRAERQRVQQEQAQQQSQVLQSHVQQEQQKLVDLIPEFKDEAKAEVIRRDIRVYAKSIGFSDQELSQVYDSRAVTALYKSMMYDKLVAGKSGTLKKVQSAPKTLRPGTSNPKSSDQEAQKKDFERLRQSGNKKDAAKLFERFL